MTVRWAVCLLGSFNRGAVAACFAADWNDVPCRPADAGTLVWAPGTARHHSGAPRDAARRTIGLQRAVPADTMARLRPTNAVGPDVAVRFSCTGGHGKQRWHWPETFASLLALRDAGGHGGRGSPEPVEHGETDPVDAGIWPS